jgi:hypothetical protein
MNGKEIINILYQDEQPTTSVILAAKMRITPKNLSTALSSLKNHSKTFIENTVFDMSTNPTKISLKLGSKSKFKNVDEFVKICLDEIKLYNRERCKVNKNNVIEKPNKDTIITGNKEIKENPIQKITAESIPNLNRSNNTIRLSIDAVGKPGEKIGLNIGIEFK